MKKFIAIVTLSIILTSCSVNNTSIYLMQYLDKGQEVEIIVDDGNYKFNKTYKDGYIDDEYIFIKRYISKKDSIKVYFKTLGKDTTAVFPISTKKILLGFNIDKEIFICTEKDSLVWKRY